jgi:hypothetical protein
MIIRVGTGHNMAWGDCHYYTYQKRKSKYYPNGIDEREDAIKDAIERYKEDDIYVSSGNRSYFKVTIEKLRNL